MVFYWLVYQDGVKKSTREIEHLTVGKNRKVEGVEDVATLVRKPTMPIKEIQFKGSFFAPVEADTTTGIRGRPPPRGDETLGQTLARMQTGETLVDTMKRTSSYEKKKKAVKTAKKKKKKSSSLRKQTGSSFDYSADSSQEISFAEDSDSSTERMDDFSLSSPKSGKTATSTITSIDDNERTSESSWSSPYSVIKAKPVDLSSTPTKSAMKRKTLKESLSCRYVCSTRNHVEFNTVEIREHIMCLGDNPACSWGPPISLSWEHTTEPQIEDCDDYTLRRNDEKFYRDEDYDYILSRNEREVILDSLGVSIREQTKADLEKRRIQQEREDTIHKLKFMKMEEKLESIRHAKDAAKRLFLRR